MPDGTTLTVPYTLSGSAGYAETTRCNVQGGCPAAQAAGVDTIGVKITYLYTWFTPLGSFIGLGHHATSPSSSRTRCGWSRSCEPPTRRPDRRDRSRGQSLVEFAISVPVFVLLLFGMLEFGFAFSHNLTLEYATREGARTGAALGPGTANIPCAQRRRADHRRAPSAS